jgi:hypothetical protein
MEDAPIDPRALVIEGGSPLICDGVRATRD